eukprot:TRINITY_DN8961_c0_g1_i2.p2 TRINITY_DN8961_c0_g1~~TRINITY_DN8961_c0_g1_i2.p2  ORF type:complete len:186 (-),score=36.39 TRINITY_DN8961_c0_g1_i2:139-696(-)
MLPSFSDFPALGSPVAAKPPSGRPAWGPAPSAVPTGPTPAAWQPIAHDVPPAAEQAAAPVAVASPAPTYIVHGSKKGGFPVTLETRARGKKVTIIHNVTGDSAALLADLKRAIGAGGVLRDNDVEIQGEHEERVAAFLVKSGCVKGVTNANKAAAAPPPKKPAPAPKSIAALDRKAQALKQQQKR